MLIGGNETAEEGDEVSVLVFSLYPPLKGGSVLASAWLNSFIDVG